MTVTIKFQKPDGTPIASFPGEATMWISQTAKNHGIDFPTSCGVGACWVCRCKILSWHEYIQIDKISPPMRTLERNEDGSFKEFFACIGWVTQEAVKDKANHDVILEKNM